MLNNAGGKNGRMPLHWPAYLVFENISCRMAKKTALVQCPDNLLVSGMQHGFFENLPGLMSLFHFVQRSNTQ
jgi:hypothetical protein